MYYRHIYFNLKKKLSTLTKLKKSISIALIIVFLITITSPVSYGKMFGKSYDSNRDYSCCDGDQLNIHHYYTTHFFFFETGSGYSTEPIGNQTAPGQCQPQCPLTEMQ